MRSLTEKELQLLYLTKDIWNQFLLLPVLHEWDQQEVMNAVHIIQKTIMSRPAIEKFKNK